MLAQNLTKKCDQPITYAFRLLNNVEKNYTTIERETLAMVYVLHKFRHYLLRNKFVSYVALLYLVKRPQLSRQVTRWMLLFLEYNFSMVYKLRCSHSVVDVVLRLLNAIENLGVLDKTIDASLFILQLEWL
jgi:hypothetical protein